VDRYKEQGSFATDPILDVDEWNNLQDIMNEAGELPKEVDHATLVNTEIAEKVKEE
jgi:NitT/TauT family transport system substrate-binding protein